MALAYRDLETALKLERLLLTSLPEDKELLPLICGEWNSWGFSKVATGLLDEFASNPGVEKGKIALGLAASGGSRDVFLEILSGNESKARSLLRNVETFLGDKPGGTEFEALFAAARYLDDSAVVERLAKHAITKAPRNQKLIVCVQMLARSMPCLDESHRESLSAYVEGVIQRNEESGSSANQISWYYMRELNRLTGRKLKLPIQNVRSQVENSLAQGGYYLQSIGSLFAMLDKEEFNVLLRESYRKAKSSDRLSLVFNVLNVYPEKLDEEMEEMFAELIAESAEEATGDVLNTYRAAINNYYLRSLQLEDLNAGFRAQALERLGKSQPEEKRKDFLIEQARAWHSAGDEERALKDAKEAFRLSLADEGSLDSQLRRAFLPKYTYAFLEVLDEVGKEQEGTVDHEKKRIALVKQSGAAMQLIETLHAAIERFPKEKTFRTELYGEFNRMGRIYEGISVLEGLAKLEPENDAHRAALERAWQGLHHPIKARKYKKPPPKPKSDSEKVQAPQPVPPPKISTSNVTAGSTPVRITQTSVTIAAPSVPSSGPSRGAGPAPTQTKVEEEQEKKVAPATIALVKKDYDAKEFDNAQVTLRRLWRQFYRLGQTRPGIIYSAPSSSNQFLWPMQDKSNSGSPVPSSNKATLGGLEAFLATEPRDVDSGQSQGAPKSGKISVFEAIGSEPFVVDEMSRWLRTLTKREYQGQAFEEMVTSLARREVADKGPEKAIGEALAKAEEGRLSGLEQHTLLAMLELHSDAGGERAAEYMNHLVRTLDPVDLWKTVRLARCFAKRGQEESALSLYKWCGTSVRYSPYSYYGMNPLTGSKLVQEIKSQLTGELRIRALDSVMSLMTMDGNNADSQMYFDNFVLTTWKDELSPPEIYERCREICQRVVEDYPSQQYKNASLMELTVQILAAGADIEPAVRGLQLLLVPEALVGDSGQHVTLMPGGGMMISSSSRSNSSGTRSLVTDQMLHRWLPSAVADWPGGEAWMEGMVEHVSKWASDQKLQVTDAVRLLSIAAVRQQEAGWDEAASASLASLRELKIATPSDTLWLSDAARRCGERNLAIEIEKQLLAERRLPVARIANLMEEVSDLDGNKRALDLGEATLEFTWAPEFLGAMNLIASKAGNEESAETWSNRLTQLLQLDSSPAKYGFVIGEGESARLYRFQELEGEQVINDYHGEIPIVLFFDNGQRKLRVFERGEREFAVQGELIVDNSGARVDPATGRGADYDLKAIPYSLVESASWRAKHPRQEVYLISALSRAKTRYFEKGAEDWKFFDQLPPAENWNTLDFDDSDWQQGKSPLGYGESIIETTLSFGDDPDNKNPSVYFRRQFSVNDPSVLAKLVGRIRADDGAVVYLNGSEVYRQNMPEGTITETTNASSSAKEGVFEQFLIAPSQVVAGRNVLAVSIHQHDADSSDLVLDMDLGALTKEELRNSSTN